MAFPTWALSIPWDIINSIAPCLKIDPLLVGCIIMVESSGFKHTTRFEPNWKYPYKIEYYAKSNNITTSTEEVHQATSWGYMQIMGTVARELGYDGNLPGLIEPETNILYGCRKLSELKSKYKLLSSVISAYNAGKPSRYNLSYVSKVLNYYNELKE